MIKVRAHNHRSMFAGAPSNLGVDNLIAKLKLAGIILGRFGKVDKQMNSCGAHADDFFETKAVVANKY